VRSIPKIKEIMLATNLDEEDLIMHAEASDYLSRHGSERKLNAIDDEVKGRIGRFYRKVRDLGIYPGPIQNGKLTWQEIVDYWEGWYWALKARPDEYPRISRSEVNEVIEKSFEELRERMRIKARPMLSLVREAMKEAKGKPNG